MKSFIRVLKVQLISIAIISFAIFFLTILPIVLLQSFGYGAQTKTALIVLASFTMVILSLIAMKYLTGMSGKPKVWILFGIFLFTIFLPINWFVYSSRAVLGPDVSKVINVEIMRNIPR